MSKRIAKVHWIPRGARTTLCFRDQREVFYANYWSDYVTCRVCLYHMGLYMPLVKLYEHQVANMKRCDFQLEFFV